jgi:hypothetical protein
VGNSRFKMGCHQCKSVPKPCACAIQPGAEINILDYNDPGRALIQWRWVSCSGFKTWAGKPL